MNVASSFKLIQYREGQIVKFINWSYSTSINTFIPCQTTFLNWLPRTQFEYQITPPGMKYQRIHWSIDRQNFKKPTVKKHQLTLPFDRRLIRDASRKSVGAGKHGHIRCDGENRRRTTPWISIDLIPATVRMTNRASRNEESVGHVVTRLRWRTRRWAGKSARGAKPPTRLNETTEP